MSIEYDEYLKQHIKNVQNGLNWMNDNLDIDRDIRSAIGEALWRTHDESKYGTKEYRAYDAYFYGGNRSYNVVQDFNYAWLHHIHNNPHHWQYWVLINDDEKDGTIALEMPKTYVAEMIADWWTFSWKTGKLGDIFDWYDEHKDRIVMHKNTRKLVEDILDKIETKLIDTCCLKENWRDEKKQSSEPDSSKIVEIDADTKEEPVEHSDISEDEEDEHKYGVPDLKKFPMPDAKHVKSAIRFFNYIDPKHEKELAEAILERMKEYDMSFEDFGVGDENRFKNYIPKKDKEEHLEHKLIYDEEYNCYHFSAENDEHIEHHGIQGQIL